MYVLYELKTGRAHSQSASLFENPNPAKWGIKETVNEGVWDAETLDFKPVPSSRRISIPKFMARFSDDELISILEASKNSSLIALFIMKMQQADYIDLDKTETINSVNKIEEVGLVAKGRAAEILNG